MRRTRIEYMLIAMAGWHFTDETYFRLIYFFFLLPTLGFSLVQIGLCYWMGEEIDWGYA